MEEHQEEIEIVEHLYYQAKAYVKYRADRHNYLSEEKGFDHFSIDSFYDLKIGDSNTNRVEKISQELYHQQISSCIEIKDLQGVSELWKDGRCYQFSPEKLYFSPSNPAHNQIEDHHLHGYFHDLVIFFKTQRTVKLIICKEGFPTGRLETREDGFTYLEKYCRDCSTRWDKKTCVQGKPTGNEEYRGEVLFREYLNDNCTTYWLEEQVDIPLNKSSDNSIATIKNDSTQKAINQHDRSLDGAIWEKEQNPIIAEPEGKKLEPVGCSEVFWTILQILALIYLLAPFVLLIAILIEFKLWIPILITLGIILIGGLISNISTNQKKYSGVINAFGRIAQFILSTFVIGMLLFGIVNLFLIDWSSSSKTRWSGDSAPSPKPIFETEFPILEENTQHLSNDTLIKIYVEWADYNGTSYSGNYSINTAEIKRSESNLNQIPIYQNNHFGRVYYSLYNHDRSGLNSMYTMFDSIQKANNLSKRDFAGVIVSMIQSQEYVLILEQGCRSTMSMNDREITAMINAGIPCDGHYLYGIKTPLKFASDLRGDCDTRTVLIYTVLKNFEYDVAILNSEFYKHSILGLNLPNQRGSFKLHQGRKYYFWETTSKGFKLGELPRENGNINYWNVVLN